MLHPSVCIIIVLSRHHHTLFLFLFNLLHHLSRVFLLLLLYDHVFCSPLLLLLSHGHVNIGRLSFRRLRALICQTLRQETITYRATRVLVLSDQQQSWRHARIVLDKTMELLVLHYRLSHVVGSHTAMAVGQSAEVTFISCAIWILGTFSGTVKARSLRSIVPGKLISPH
jgi:hypothetical protein